MGRLKKNIILAKVCMTLKHQLCEFIRHSTRPVFERYLLIQLFLACYFICYFLLYLEFCFSQRLSVGMTAIVYILLISLIDEIFLVQYFFGNSYIQLLGYFARPSSASYWIQWPAETVETIKFHFTIYVFAKCTFFRIPPYRGKIPQQLSGKNCIPLIYKFNGSGKNCIALLYKFNGMMRYVVEGIVNQQKDSFLYKNLMLRSFVQFHCSFFVFLKHLGDVSYSCNTEKETQASWGRSFLDVHSMDYTFAKVNSTGLAM